MIWADREQKFDIGSYQGYIPINSKGGDTLIVYGITNKDGSGYNRLVPSEDEN
jgi:hypothetical protein